MTLIFGAVEAVHRLSTIMYKTLGRRNYAFFLRFRVDPVAFGSNEQFKKISITYDDHWFAICLSNKKIYVIKRSIPTAGEGNSIVV